MTDKRVLLVEDDEDVSDYLKPLLADKGFLVDVAIDGRSGLKKLDEFRPDLVLLDLMMPGLDGLGFLRALKSAPRPTMPKILVLTAVQKVGGSKEAMDLGADAFLTKPVDNQDLVDKINQLLA